MKRTFTINEQGKVELSLSEIDQIIRDAYDAGTKAAQIEGSSTWYHYTSNQTDSITILPFIQPINETTTINPVTKTITLSYDTGITKGEL